MREGTRTAPTKSSNSLFAEEAGLQPTLDRGTGKTHLWGILKAIQLNRTVILFHKGGLLLLPAGISER